MILKFVRHLASHKQVFNVEVDVADPDSIAQALSYLNHNLLGNIEKTNALCLQNTERNKLLKLRLSQNNVLLSKKLACGRLNAPWANQVKEDLALLGVNLSGRDHGSAEFIFARAALEHSDLALQLVNFVDRITIYTAMADTKLMSYADLTNLGFMASVAIVLYRPTEIPSAIALFNALGQYNDGSYSERFSSSILIALYQQYKQYPQVNEILAHHLSSFICYPDSQWIRKVDQIAMLDGLASDLLFEQYGKALEEWCFDFHIEEPEHYIERFIEPLFKEQADVERIEQLYRPFKEAALKA